MDVSEIWASSRIPRRPPLALQLLLVESARVQSLRPQPWKWRRNVVFTREKAKDNRQRRYIKVGYWIDMYLGYSLPQMSKDGLLQIYDIEMWSHDSYLYRYVMYLNCFKKINLHQTTEIDLMGTWPLYFWANPLTICTLVWRATRRPQSGHVIIGILWRRCQLKLVLEPKSSQIISQTIHLHQWGVTDLKKK